MGYRLGFVDVEVGPLGGDAAEVAAGVDPGCVVCSVRWDPARCRGGGDGWEHLCLGQESTRHCTTTVATTATIAATATATPTKGKADVWLGGSRRLPAFCHFEEKGSEISPSVEKTVGQRGGAVTRRTARRRNRSPEQTSPELSFAPS